MILAQNWPKTTKSSWHCSFKKWYFMFHSWPSISVSTLILRLGKVEFLNKLISETLFLGFVKFEIKQWLLAYQEQFCAWFCLVQQPIETARVFISESFSKRNGFIFLLPASRSCLMPWQDFFVLSFGQSRQILSKFAKLSAIFKHRRKKLCDDVNRASVL